MKSYEVVRSVVMRHSQNDAARILTLNLATCITADSQQDETAALARLGDTIRTLCNAVTDLMKEDLAYGNRLTSAKSSPVVPRCADWRSTSL
jgi:hypothetical protein